MVCEVAPEVFSIEASPVQNAEASLQNELAAVRVDLTGSVSLTRKNLTPGVFSFTIKDVTDRDNIKSIATVCNDDVDAVGLYVNNDGLAVRPALWVNLSS